MKQNSWLDSPFQSLFPVALLSFLLVGAVRLVLDHLKSNHSQIFNLYGKPEGLKQPKPVFVSSEDRFEAGCNVFEGSWVWDNVTYPLYTEESCPYLVKQTTCQRNGRPDSFYQNWRWKPSGCELPRFDPLKLLDVLRNKRLMFIGDSVQRGQFESMVCMLQSVIPEGKKSLNRVPPMKIFKAEVSYIFKIDNNVLCTNALSNGMFFRNTMHLLSTTGHPSLWNQYQIMQQITLFGRGWLI